ncbi:hypothetical protein A8F94_21280 [Bacillus sp. FJAT-27225]|nr:hypothetical protein A8F94_21280 [Bacillus sp. FJAT-27225]
MQNKTILPVQKKSFEAVVDFRSRMLAFRGACGEPPRRQSDCGVSPVPLVPQESRTFRSNQLDTNPLPFLIATKFAKTYGIIQATKTLRGGMMCENV